MSLRQDLEAERTRLKAAIKRWQDNSGASSISSLDKSVTINITELQKNLADVERKLRRLRPGSGRNFIGGGY